MWRYIAVTIFIAQTLGASAMFGTSLRNASANTGYFGKQYLPSAAQVILPAWLVISLFLNVVFISLL